MQLAYLTRRFALHGVEWQFAIWLRQALLIVVAGILSARLSFRPEEENSLAVRLAAALVALAVLVTAAIWHHRVQPYAFRYQNGIELLLFGANVQLLACASEGA